MFKKKSVTPASLGIRGLIGAYLLYLAYTLIPAIQKAPDTKEMIFWIAIVAVFSIVGGLAIIFSLKSFIKGEYDKGEENELQETISLDSDKKDEEEK
ncbi:rhomboid family intramembrane serine protease [Candidatus Galacturonibacter soehngenii]|uniref:Rhomboid family intramembrane serine protease n=1 Tax=Candidatus Galacturonatibacter soehngenii TaxID=2307010 RepID=A0A7V7UF01_9FIRM|nr:rhomboid family intramembrane serine protease [Candidatus Galacturonibacter soehngenii]KAB1435734.1 rhomboid family intramembrane serine protease [Candidatus Galacturonibacter soehngenii]